jgi:hypothetical protein
MIQQKIFQASKDTRHSSRADYGMVADRRW